MRKITTDGFIKRAEYIHNGFYDYSKVDYKDDCTKVIIICKIHGEFEQLPGGHTRGAGCPDCAKVKQGKTKRNNTAKKFIERARLIHGNKYNYDLIEYDRAGVKVKIICLEHGIFEQTPNNHLQGNGCPSCCKNKKSTLEEFMSKANNIHNYFYYYDNTIYVNSSTKISINCPNHGEFRQTPSMHIMGQGCPKCYFDKTSYYKYKNKKTILYYVGIGDYYKFGLTVSSVNNRYSSEIKKGLIINIINQWVFEDGWVAYKIEQLIKRLTTYCSVPIDESPIKGGYSEVRSRCILSTIEGIIDENKKN